MCLNFGVQITGIVWWCQRELCELDNVESLGHGWKEGINKAYKIVLIVAVLG